MSALAVLAALAMLTTSGTAEAAFPGTNGKIAFQSNRHVASGEIYTITPGGTATRTTFSNGSADPAYSPDGSKIAFASDTQIFVMNADGSGRRQVTTSPTTKTDPTWSADGTRIAYVANSFDVDGQTDLEVWAIRADGTARTQLTSNAFPDTQPAWSPLGASIAFVSTRPDDTDRNVYVMDPDGTNQQSVTANSPPGCSPNCYQGHDDDRSWSPDGSKIAHIHGDGPGAACLTSGRWTRTAPTGSTSRIATPCPTRSPHGPREGTGSRRSGPRIPTATST